MTSANPVHTDGNAVPPLDPELEGLFEDLAAIQDPGADQILAGLRYTALNRHTLDETQTRIAWLGGGSDGTNLLNLIGRIVARLADADLNPALRDLPLGQQDVALLRGEGTAYVLSSPTLHQFAADTAAAIDGI